MKLILGKIIDGKIKPLADIQLNQTGKKMLIDKSLKLKQGNKKNNPIECKQIKVNWDKLF